MAPALGRSILGVAAAIAITSTMDATGLTAFSALPLLPLVLLFWCLERPPRPRMGFAWARTGDFGLALLYPLVVIGTGALVSIAAGAAHLSEIDWRRASFLFARVALGTFLTVILTEEGFFRGWLWASLERAGESPNRVLIWTSVAFALWHWSWVTLKTGGDLPSWQIPVFLVNAAFMGAVWGLLRAMSGSVIVASLSHGVWNGIAYVFFGVGTKAGALGIANTAIFGPEVGIVGLAINAAFAVALWKWWHVRTSRAG
jgi:uncharacterized protein